MKVEYVDMFDWKILDGEADKLTDHIRDVAGYKEAKSAMYVLGACNIVEAAVRLGIVVPAENCGMIRDQPEPEDALADHSLVDDYPELAAVSRRRADVSDDEVEAVLDAIEPAIKQALKAFMQEREDYVRAMSRSGAYKTNSRKPLLCEVCRNG